MATTDRLGLPLIEAGQAQKEMTHNEALATLDAAVQASVVAAGRDDPPAAPLPGQCWAVGSAPAGDWAGHAGAIAAWTGGGWRFVAARPGLQAWSLADATVVRWDGAAWRIGEVSARRLLIGGTPVVGPRAAGIADPAGGTTVDAEARAAVTAILTALRGHGLIAGGTGSASAD